MLSLLGSKSPFDPPIHPTQFMALGYLLGKFERFSDEGQSETRAVRGWLRLATGTIVHPSGGYKQPCIFWTANVSHSGQAKTPPQQVAIKPLEDMEEEADARYEEDLKDYRRNSEDLSEPTRQRFILNNVTTQTKLRIHHQNPRGLLEYSDELVSDYTRLNQFRGGKGDDLQLELGFFNGSTTNYDRADARLFLRRTGFSKTGTYQWDTLSQQMADETNFIASGYAARFLYCSVSDAPPRYLDLFNSSDAVNQLQTKLRWLYEELSSLPEADYLLCDEAKVLFQRWNHMLIRAEIEEKHFAVSLVYSKIESYTARLALWLHIVNSLLSGKNPAPTISGETMQSAIEIASFYLGQHKLIHAYNSPDRKLEGIFLKIQTQAEKYVARIGKGVSASFLKTRINALKKWSVDRIRQLWQKLAAAGHGRIEGEGSQSVYFPLSDVGDIGSDLLASPTTTTVAHQRVQDSVGEIGNELAGEVNDIQKDFSDRSITSDATENQFTNVPNLAPEPEVNTVVGGVHQYHDQPPTEEENNSPSIEDLQALLLACQTLTQLKAFKRQYSQRGKQAYRSLSAKQQQQVDALAAQAVPGDVYKYEGRTIEYNEQKLPSGALVFIDPNARSESAGRVSVWLLRGLELGWKKALSIKSDSLSLIKQATGAVIDSHQLTSLPGFEEV